MIVKNEMFLIGVLLLARLEVEVKRCNRCSAKLDVKGTHNQFPYAITGDPNDWKVLGISPKIREGQRVILHRYVVKATALFNPVGFGMDQPTGPSATTTVNQFFMTERQQGIADCTKAMHLVLVKGLIDNLKSGEFDELRFTYAEMPLIKKLGRPEKL